MTKICRVNTKAHPKRYKSPVVICRPSVMQSKYIPHTASTTAIHTFAPIFFRKKIPASGTKIKYRAVIKPAFPGSLLCKIPICCSMVAANNIIPQLAPPRSNVFFPVSLASFVSPEVFPTSSATFPVFVSFRFFPADTAARIPKNTASETPASMDRIPIKAKGPIYFIPSLCATKESPQINAASNSRTFPLIRFVILLSSYETLGKYHRSLGIPCIAVSSDFFCVLFGSYRTADHHLGTYSFLFT